MKTIINEANVVDKANHRYLSKAAVADLLGITGRALDGWMARGIIPYFKVGRWVRFYEEDIHTHLRKHYRVERTRSIHPFRKSSKLERVAATILTLESHSPV